MRLSDVMAVCASLSSLPFTLASPVDVSAASDPPTSAPNETGACAPDDPGLRLPLVALYSLIFLVGLVGNLFALWVFLFLHSRRNSVHVFLVNCAAADLVLLACLPFRIVYHVNGNRWALGSVACKVVGNLFYMNMYLSIALLGLIGLDRYSRLKGRGRAQRGPRAAPWGRSWRWSWAVCGALWGLALAALAPMIAAAEDREESGRCFQYRWRSGKGKGKAYFNALMVALFWLVFVALAASYASIASRLLGASRDNPDLPNAQKYKRIAKKSFFVLFLFAACFGPYHAFRPVYIVSQLSGAASCDRLRLVDRTNEVMLLLSAFNSCLDPVMYFLLSGSVRKTALRALGRRRSGRAAFVDEAAFNSSTIELRRPSTSVGLSVTPAATPRASIINFTLRPTAPTTHPTSK